MQTAYDQKNHKAYQLLSEYKKQVIEARVQKNFPEKKRWAYTLNKPPTPKTFLLHFTKHLFAFFFKTQIVGGTGG